MIAVIPGKPYSPYLINPVWLLAPTVIIKILSAWVNNVRYAIVNASPVSEYQRIAQYAKLDSSTMLTLAIQLALGKLLLRITLPA